jgi:hypothetical protein
VFEFHLQKSPSRGRPRWWLYPVLVLMALVLWAAPGLCRVAVLGGCAGPKFTAPTVLKGFLPTQECQGEKPLARLGDDDDDEGDDDVGTV